MGRKGLLIFAVATALLTLAAVSLLDRALAEFIRASGWENAPVFSTGMIVLDTLSGIRLHILLPGLLLAITGAAMLMPRRLRGRGALLLFVGATHVASMLLCGLGKDLFRRVRPHELLDGGDWGQSWFAAGSSFPSGHAAFYFGLFLPLCYLFPRWCPALLVAPLFVAAARVNANMHFLSDVTASMALTAVVTVSMATAMRIESRRATHG